MNKTHGIFLYGIVLFISVFTSCSIPPTAGTETGNPDITACLETTLHTFDSANQWLPAMYLPDGESQLNPEKITDQWRQSALAKRMVEDSSADVPPEPEITHVVITKYDTIIIIDTQFIHDTIITNRLLTDTLITDSEKQADVNDDITSSITVEYIRNDTLIINDTVVTFDTVITSRNDTLIGSNDRGMIVSDEETTTAPVVIALESKSTEQIYDVTPDSLGEMADFSDASLSSEMRSGFLYRIVTKTTNNNGTQIKEKYVYNTNMTDQFSLGSSSVKDAKGTISYTILNTETTIEVDFDAGNDNLFSTVDDNRIIGLFKRTIIDSKEVETMYYGVPYFGKRTDTLYLQNEQTVGNGVIDLQTTTYKYLTDPNNVTNHRLNRLLGCSRHVDFSDTEEVEAMVLDITLQSSVQGSDIPISGIVYGIINFGKDNIGIIDATADFEGKIIIGKYSYRGKNYHFSYTMGQNVVSLTPEN